MPQDDPVAAALRKQPLTNAQRADAWDAYASATSADDLAAKLRDLKVPDALKADLWDLKAATPQATAPPAPVAAPAPATPATPAPTSGVASDLAQKAGQIPVVGPAVQGAMDWQIGQAKSAGNLVVGAGRAAQMIPGVTAAVDAVAGPGASASALKAAQAYVAPSNATQEAAKTATDIAQFFLPVPGASRVRGGMAVKDAALTLLQTGSPTAAAESLGLSAMGPIVGRTAGRVGHWLHDSAHNQVMKALGPTKERFKAMAERLAPEIRQRGLVGSREGLQERAAEQVAEIGPQIDQAIQAYGARQAGVQPVLDALDQSMARYVRQNAAGQMVVLDPRPIAQIHELQDILRGLGPAATAEQLVQVRRVWDEVVDAAGGFAHRAPGSIGMPLADRSEAEAKRIATRAIRQHLDATVPELSAINQEYAFWRRLDDVLAQTLRRTAPQRPGLGAAAAKMAGASVGGMTGSGVGPAGTVGGAMLGAKITQKLTDMFESPRWRLADAQVKDRLAAAIASGSAGRVLSVLHTLSKPLPSQAQQAVQ